MEVATETFAVCVLHITLAFHSSTRVFFAYNCSFHPSTQIDTNKHKNDARFSALTRASINNNDPQAEYYYHYYCYIARFLPRRASINNNDPQAEYYSYRYTVLLKDFCADAHR